MTTERAKSKWFDPGKGTVTPWGRADYATRLTRGVTFYGTPGHGGLSVALGWARDNLTLPAQYLGMLWGGGLWYEEDCKVNLVFFEHPNLASKLIGREFTAEEFRSTVEAWDPDYFMPEFREACRKAGDLPGLLMLQPGDLITLAASSHPILRVTPDWITKGKSRYRLVTSPMGAMFRLSEADVRGRLWSILREGQEVWTRPRESPWEVKSAMQEERRQRAAAEG